ncbi:MAG TPA: glycosyltransferase family 4 protein [Vicinamibacteria bacterium]|nr:glycosyltransferase family 4 protein [Vicinamibacteria bacterium]
MRIGLVVYGSLDVVSGGNVYDRMLVEHLRDRGHDVEVVSFPLLSYALRITQNWQNRTLARRLRSGSFDVLLQDELVHPSLFRLNRSLRSPIVSIVHHLLSSEERHPSLNRFYRMVEKSYLETVAAFVFNSQTTRETVEALLARPTSHVVATPGGDRLRSHLTPGEIEARAREKDGFRLLFVGNLIPRKGLHILLDTLPSLGHRRWHLDVVGSLDMDPAYTEDARRRIQAYGLGDRVTLHGSLEGDALRQRFERAQLLVVPSTYEGFGIVYLEAMGFGLPVVASSTGATHEIVRQEINGFLVPPGDTIALGGRLEHLMDDRDRLAKMSLAACESFRDHPTWGQSMAAIEAFLGEVAGGLPL